MNHVNLIPAYRISARKARRHLRRWALACALFAGVLLIAYGAAWATFETHSPGLNAELQEAEERIGRSRAAIASVRSELEEARAELAAKQEVAALPDWSILLASMSAKLRQSVVLKRCHLGPLQQKTIARMGPRRRPLRFTEEAVLGRRPHVLRLTGYGRSHGNVSRLILSLEQMGLFSEVHLVWNAREPFLSENVVAFEIACVMENESGTSR